MNFCQTCTWWTPNQSAVEQSPDALYECANPTLDGLRTRELFGCTEHLGSNATIVNVPQHVRNGTMTDPNPNKLDGPTEVLIISCARDFDWLVLALKCASKYLHGFQGITVAHPNQEAERFRPLLDQFAIRLHGYNEVPGKGHIQHMAVMASADLFLPAGTRYVLTTDSDGMMHTPSTPEHFAWDDKPHWIIRSWDSLITEDPRNPGSKVISDNMQWRGPTAAQLGFDPPVFSMCMNIQLMPLDLLASYRNHIESVQGKNFHQYMIEGRNEFPPNRMDFTALGAFFYQFHRARFRWFDVSNPPYPKDRKKAYWSWGGITPEIRAEIEDFLRWKPTPEEESRMNL